MVDAEPRLLPDVDVPSLDAYLESGGGEGLLAARERSADEIIEEVTASGLRGRGGAGFPTGMKWGSIHQASADPDSTIYAVANAAEGEPGTYKDRAIMQRNPYLFLEGLLVAMRVVGAERGYVGIKRRFQAQIGRLVTALSEMAAAGWEGADRVDVATGPDEYLFGEEKAMLETIEGKLPMPRLLPPYQVGLFAGMTQPNPTLVNNVETLANVPLILAHGTDWFRSVGTEDSPGTMIFTVSGDVGAPGLYELPLGTTLRTLVEDIAQAEDVKAIFGGVAQAVITSEMLDTPLGWDDMARAGTGLGSGGFVVYDASHCIVRALASLSHFLMIESCGQCWACMLGTDRLTAILNRIDAGEGAAPDLDALFEGARKVTDQNRCYLPVGEQLMVLSVLERFGGEVADHLGQPCWSERDPVIPKIESLDLETGEVQFDPDYARKLPDWSYAPE